ncbi:Repair protein Rad1 [Klebsormidium nitens]|uniref:Repair protein Rad1 n=1 Tax=Klebsormidium nitens TaxID=105231 RepID=A0A1Y1I742_KLENI|nr:Repair protein Rad1 [Klebsormidium nitens]|eukprot:GAQ86775.1 Repair protein Rad1 [Klebsormidium nitens]
MRRPSSGAAASSRGGGASEFELVCRLECVQGLVDALTSIKWKKQQDAICELSEHGMLIVVEESSCLQGKVYFRKELFKEYQYHANVRPRFGVSLTTLVDCLNTFASTAGTTALELRYPGTDMELILRLTDESRMCTDAEIRTRIPDSVPYDFSIDDDDANEPPVSFAVKSSALKDAFEDLEWPGSSIQIALNPEPPVVTFRGEGHGDLQIDFFYDSQTDLFIAFQCDRAASFWYKYKFLRATTANIPGSILKDNRGSKLTIDNRGLLKVQHIISIRQTAAQVQQNQDSSLDGRMTDQSSRISYVEFYVLPDEEPVDVN